MNRIIVTDQPGQPILVSAYGSAGQMVQLDLEPLRALSLAERLLTAARSRLPTAPTPVVDALRAHFCLEGIPAIDA